MRVSSRKAGAAEPAALDAEHHALELDRAVRAAAACRMTKPTASVPGPASTMK
jgi:hypothetical protein